MATASLDEGRARDALAALVRITNTPIDSPNNNDGKAG
jgi:hypothetical protein